MCWSEAEGELVVVGASLGGYVALAMARTSPDRVPCAAPRGLARDRGSTRAPRATRADARGRAQRRDRRLEPRVLADRAWGQNDEELVSGIEALRDRRDATEVVTAFEGPLVLVVGDHDELLPVDEARGIAESAPAGRLEVVEGAGHVVSADAPGRFNEILLGLLHPAG